MKNKIKVKGFKIRGEINFDGRDSTKKLYALFPLRSHALSKIVDLSSLFSIPFDIYLPYFIIRLKIVFLFDANFDWPPILRRARKCSFPRNVL